MTATTNETAVLVLRDAGGNIYLLAEDQIRSTRADAKQAAAVRGAIGDQDVSGFALGPGGFAPVGLVNVDVTVAPQINTAVGLNVIGVNLGVAQQVLTQDQTNLFAVMRRR